MPSYSMGFPAGVIALRDRVGAAILVCLAVLLLSSVADAQPASPSLPTSTVSAVLFSDPHFDPFRDPGKAKRLAAAPVEQWPAIFAEAPTADANVNFAALQQTCHEKLADADIQLELSALNDAQAAHPAVVLVAGDMLVHAFGCRYGALLDPSGTDKAGLADFAVKTLQFQLKQLHQRFPGTTIHLALGNNDSDCEDYALDDDSRFLYRLSETVAEGWSGITAKERTAAKQDFERFGSYNLPLAGAVPNARVLVLDDLYLSSDYRGTCGKTTNRASATALLTWVAVQLAQARRLHQPVWLLAHIPPEVNVYRTYLHPHDICHGERPAMFLPNDALTQLLTQYADTVRVFLSGHTHVDEIHLLEASGVESRPIALKVIPSVSPISTNAPAYLRAAIDANTATLVDYTKRVASSASGPAIQWTTAYEYRDRFQEPAFTAGAVADLLRRWQTAPDTAADQVSAYQASVASGLRLLAFRVSWPQQLCAMQHSSASAFTACACAATGGLLPPVQNAK